MRFFKFLLLTALALAGSWSGYVAGRWIAAGVDKDMAAERFFATMSRLDQLMARAHEAQLNNAVSDAQSVTSSEADGRSTNSAEQPSTAP